MVGAGVFLSTGYMAQDMSPSAILLAWVVGAVLALCGAVAYAEVSKLIPRGGGEYRYLSTLLHPAIGTVAGYWSALVGCAGPTAIDALAIDAFARKLSPGLPPYLMAVTMIVSLTALHAFGFKSSTRAQNGLVVLKALLMTAFVGICVLYGSLEFPTWMPPKAPQGTSADTFVGSLFFIAFAYSGWNAAVYVASEFENPRRDVGRAMLLGTTAVAALYFVVNYFFVANLTPADGAAVFHYDADRVTLGHVIIQHLIGDNAAKLMSLVIIALLTSAMSAMTLTGPRILSAMGGDSRVLKALGGTPGQPPRLAIVLQGVAALALVFIQEFRNTLENLGALLVLFAALTVFGLFRARLRSITPEKPATGPLVAAAVYVCSALYMLKVGLSQNETLRYWLGGLLAWMVVEYLLRRRQQPAPA